MMKKNFLSFKSFDRVLGWLSKKLYVNLKKTKERSKTPYVQILLW